MILIGTSHIDIQGPERLEHLLKQIQPKIIIVEVPVNFSLDDIAKQIIEGRATQIQRVQATNTHEPYKQLMSNIYAVRGYDALVPIEYARKTGAEVYPVDIQSNRDIIINEDEQLLSILTMIYGSHRLPYEQLRKVFIDWHERMFYSPDALKKWALSFGFKVKVENGPEEKREQTMAKQTLEKNPDVHIGGLTHIFGDSTLPTTPLYLRLGDIVSQRLRLSEWSKY